MISAACLMLSVAVLVFILRYRVHIHISYEPQPERRTKRRRSVSRPARSTQIREPEPSAEVSALTDALVGLGASRINARAAAMKAAADNPDLPFPELLRHAIFEATNQKVWS